MSYLQDIRDVEGSDCVLDIHASNIYLTEIPQIRINELHEEKLVPLAQETNVDFIWVHGASTVLESTFAYSLNNIGTPVLVVEMGVGMKITKAYGDQLVDGILNLMKKMGIWTGDASTPRKPIISKNPEDVSYLNAKVSGIFLPSVKHWVELKKGDMIGKIVDPLSGKVLDEVVVPVKGILFTIRDYPVVGEGEKSVCIVGSSRENEVQQIYCCSKLVKKFRQLEAEGRICEGHKILIIPSMKTNIIVSSIAAVFRSNDEGVLC